MVKEMIWKTPEGDQIDILEHIKKYIDLGIPISIGTDSMIKADGITFASAICFHSSKKNVGNYYVCKRRYDRNAFKNLFSRLGNEIILSIEIAKWIKDNFPDAVIEVHVDVSDSPDNISNCAADYAKAWDGYQEFKLVIKPDAWAASGCADWHTK